MLKNLKIDRDLHHLHQGFQKKTGDRLKGNLKRIQKENRTLKRVRKEKKDSIYFPDKVIRFNNKVSNCFENSSIGCTHRDKSSFLDLSFFYLDFARSGKSVIIASTPHEVSTYIFTNNFFRYSFNHIFFI